jgi:predicted enzyme related to lactoylglutathione lyase
MTPHGQFYWNELMTRDPASAKRFYGETLGWTFDDMPMPDGTTYSVAKAGGQNAGGIFDATAHLDADAPESWMAYIAVDDVDAAIEAARARGATILREPFDVPGVGRIAMLTDPHGAAMGWMTPAPAPE